MELWQARKVLWGAEEEAEVEEAEGVGGEEGEGAAEEGEGEVVGVAEEAE